MEIQPSDNASERPQSLTKPSSTDNAVPTVEAEGMPDPHPPRRGPAFHPVLMEVAGCMEDVVVRDVTQRLRKYHNRYSLILRCMFTLVATTVPESRLFGDDVNTCAGEAAASSGSGSHSAKRPLFIAPQYALSANKTYPLVRRLYPSSPANPTAALEATTSSPSHEPALGASAGAAPTTSFTWVDTGGQCMPNTDATSGPHRAVHLLEDFVAYHFLPLAMTHNAPADPILDTAGTPLTTGRAEAAPQSSDTFILRHYVNEASRNASFMFTDPFHRTESTALNTTPCAAVLVDPREEQVDAYLADLDRFRATLTCIVFTHCYVDGGSGLTVLLDRFPDARVASGVPLCPAGTTVDIPISPFLHLRTVAVPAFSPECLLVEVHAGNTLVGLCTGVLWSTDAAPRWDLLQWRPLPPVSQEAAATSPPISPYGGGDRDAALTHTYNVLREHLYEPYFAPMCCPASSKTGREGEADDGVDEEGAADTSSLQRVVLLPTHGGYSNVTNQLDLYWAAHLGDLVRMKHSRAVLDTLATTPEAFVKYNKRIPPLPHPPLFDASRLSHLRHLLALVPAEQRTTCVSSLPPDMRHALSVSFDPFASPSTVLCSTPSPQPMSAYVNLVDVRDAKDYHALHLSGSVNVPMSFPGVAYGARRAELWLQCVLVPHQPIVAICAGAAQRAEVHRRLSALSPGCAVAVFTLDDLPHPTWPTTTTAASSSTTTTVATPGGWRAVHCALSERLSVSFPVPQDLTWVQHAEALPRLTSYEHLVAIEPKDTRVVLDVRTPYEFKNGSHQHSVHVELSELCMMAVSDAMQASPPLQRSDGCGGGGEGGVAEVGWRVGGSPRLADAYMEKVHVTALMASLPIVRQRTSLTDLVIYCAGGYRSLIAASLLQRAVETSANSVWRGLRIADVSGGAFQIMTQRPDLWRVKDRSIICIS